MRVGFFTEVYRPVVNGVVASVDGLASGLRARGHEVYCFAPKVPGYAESDGPVFRMPSLPLPSITPYRLTVPVVSRRNRHRILRRLDVLHAHSPFVTGWMSVRYARRLRIPLVYTYHTRLEEYAHYLPFDLKATRFAASTLTRTFANSADAVIVPTPAMRDRLREIGVTARIEVVPSGIDLAHFESGRRREDLRFCAGAKDGGRVLLFVGRLAKEKNLDVLIDAVAASSVRCSLLIAGDGPERQALEHRVAALGLEDRVRFLGLAAREQLPDLYASCDAFVFPSTTETQGLVLVEALASGAYVIAAGAQAQEVLGAAGRVVHAAAPDFARAFEALPATPAPGQAAVARDQARRYGIEGQAQAIEEIYGGLIERVPAAAGS